MSFLLPALSEELTFLTFEPLAGPSTTSRRSSVSGSGARYEPYRRPTPSSSLFSSSTSNHSFLLEHYDDMPIQMVDIVQARRMHRQHVKAAEEISEQIRNLNISQSSEEDEVVAPQSPVRQSKSPRSPTRGGSFESPSTSSSTGSSSSSSSSSSSRRARGSSVDAGSSRRKHHSSRNQRVYRPCWSIG